MSFFLFLSAHISFSVIMFSSSSSDDDSTVSAPRDGNKAPVRGRLPFPRLPTRTRDAAGKFVPLGVQYPDMEIPDCVYEWSSVQDYMAEVCFLFIVPILGYLELRSRTLWFFRVY